MTALPRVASAPLISSSRCFHHFSSSRLHQISLLLLYASIWSGPAVAAAGQRSNRTWFGGRVGVCLTRNEGLK